MKNDAANQAFDNYLHQVNKHLKYMPISEKTDILSELKSTFHERLANGQAAEDILAHMETPKELAASYLGQSLTRNSGFSWQRFLMAFGFFSFASTAWAVVIPALAICTVAFFFSSAVSLFAGAASLLKGTIHAPLIDNLQFMFFTHEFTGLPALFIGILLAALFLGLGILCWKATIGMVHLVQTRRIKLQQEA